MIKIVLIGSGAVGTSSLYSLLNLGVQAEYVLIDVFPDVAKGHARDLTDAVSAMPQNGSTFKAGDYKDCKNASVVIITAGRPQKSAEETRLQMVGDNARIISDIGEKIKSSGFSGITIISSNPCDVLTTVYQKVTGFNENKVISSGTMLDTARLKRFIGEEFRVNPDSINGYVLGEHGDKSISAYSSLKIGPVSLSDYVKSGRITKEKLEKISKNVINEAYEIIKLKRATYYGIGVCIAHLVLAIINNSKVIFSVGIKLDNTFKYPGIYLGYPAIISEKGWTKLPGFKISAAEQKLFDESAKNLKEFCNKAFSAINKKK